MEERTQSGECESLYGESLYGESFQLLSLPVSISWNLRHNPRESAVVSLLEVEDLHSSLCVWVGGGGGEAVKGGKGRGLGAWGGGVMVWSWRRYGGGRRGGCGGRLWWKVVVEVKEEA